MKVGSKVRLNIRSINRRFDPFPVQGYRKHRETFLYRTPPVYLIVFKILKAKDKAVTLPLPSSIAKNILLFLFTHFGVIHARPTPPRFGF